MTDNEGGFGFWISVLNRSARTYFQKELQHLRVGPGQQSYLLALKPGEEIVQEELAARLRVNRANVSRAVQSLAEKGYVSRKREERDMREWKVSLTEEGERVRIEVESIAREWIGQLQEALSKEEWRNMEEYLSRLALIVS